MKSLIESDELFCLELAPVDDIPFRLFHHLLQRFLDHALRPASEPGLFELEEELRDFAEPEEHRTHSAKPKWDHSLHGEPGTAIAPSADRPEAAVHRVETLDP